MEETFVASRLKFWLLVCIVLFTYLLLSTQSYAQTWYNIVNQNSGKCVDAAGWGTTNGTVVQQYTCGNQQTNQEWQLVPTDSGYDKVYNRNAASELWGVSNASTSDGALIVLWDSNGSYDQQWSPQSSGNGYYKLVNRNSGECLDVNAGSTQNSVQLQQWTCNGGTNQAWALNVIGSEGPYGGTPWAIPGTIQAENYDTGGQGVGYSVSSVNGTGNSYRSDGVDLETTTDTGGGYDLGWTSSGQWFRYTVKVSSAGTYTVSFRLASPNGVSDGFHLANSSGTNLSGSVNVPNTGGWQNWTSVSATVTLPAGQQVLTLAQDNSGWNLNYMTFTSGSGCSSIIPGQLGGPLSGTLTNSAGTWSWGNETGSYPQEWFFLLNGNVAGEGMELQLAPNGQMYMTDGPGSWWIWNGSSWSSSSQPTNCGYTIPQSGTTIPSASQIIDNSDVVWTVSNGYSYENGSADSGANITLLLWYNSNIYANTTSYGWYEHGPSGWYAISGDPRGSITPYGVPAPSGKHWTTTFDDEFTQDSSLNTSKWNPGASNTDWCYEDAGNGKPAGTYFLNEDRNNPCAQVYTGLAFDSTNGLTMTSNGSPSAAMTSGGTTAASAKFTQKFGYWEARIKVPNMSDSGNSAHSDFWLHTVPMLANAFAPEFNIGERPTWLGKRPGFHCDPSTNNDTQMSFSVHDSNSGEAGGYYGNGGVDLSQDFHTYAMWWNNDGSGPYGSVQMYLDGTPLFSSPYILNSADTNLADGVDILISLDQDCPSGTNNNDPFQIQYVRVWRLDSN